MLIAGKNAEKQTFSFIAGENATRRVTWEKIWEFLIQLNIHDLCICDTVIPLLGPDQKKRKNQNYVHIKTWMCMLIATYLWSPKTGITSNILQLVNG